MDPNQPVLDPTTRAFLKSIEVAGIPELHTLSVAEARAQFARGQALVPVPKLPADIERRTLPLGPKGNVHITVVRPKGSKSPLPGVMFFHGGGWVVGNFETHERPVREIANGAGAAVVFVEYSLAPEAHYPVANEEAYAATQWVADHGREIGVDSGRLAVVGDSAGANMAAVVCLLAKQRSGPDIAAQVLFYPPTGGSPDLPSRKLFGEGYYFTKPTGQWMWDNYIGDHPSKGYDPFCLPLLASLEQLRGLPPALVVTAECDVLRDEGEAYARKLTQAGVPVTGTRYLGTIHGFTLTNALAGSPPTRAAIAQACAMLRETFAAKRKEAEVSA
ncbi:MAG TPA: alpha/beta hydrolase [Verrucomicrobiae bacterium]|jgi:acetyl esterase|nr:alpha/beta hydrolase [Verrucomicrobiae bacterium]